MPAYGDTDRVMQFMFTAKILMTYFQRVSGYLHCQLQYNFLFLYYHISFVSICMSTCRPI